MITIYHNPRCTKSREGLAIVETSKQEFKIIKYLEDHLTEDQLVELIQKLRIKPIDLVRTSEKIWKELYKGKEITDNQIITAMAQNPKLIERPIVTIGDKATIGRPKENIIDLLEKNNS